MRIFLYYINYEHYRTNKINEVKIAIVKAATEEEAREKVWKLYGCDNAYIALHEDITDEDSISYSIYQHNFN